MSPAISERVMCGGHNRRIIRVSPTREVIKLKTVKPQRGYTAQTWKMPISAELWRHIFDAIKDPAFLHDTQFRLLLANAAYCREAGVTEEEVLGKPYWEVF